VQWFDRRPHHAGPARRQFNHPKAAAGSSSTSRARRCAAGRARAPFLGAQRGATRTTARPRPRAVCVLVRTRRHYRWSCRCRHLVFSDERTPELRWRCQHRHPAVAGRALADLAALETLTGERSASLPAFEGDASGGAPAQRCRSWRCRCAAGDRRRPQTPALMPRWADR